MNNTEENEVYDTSIRRSLVYSLLARLYRAAVDEQFIVTLINEGLLADLQRAIDDQRTAAAVRIIEDEIRENVEQLDTYLAELENDYNSLLVGPGPLLAPPWESVYRTRERLVFGEPTLEVRDFFRSFGLMSKSKGREPDDHITLEMEFMAWLCQKTGEADTIEQRNSLIDGQQRFLTSHLNLWAPQFCADVEKGAKTKFYQALGQLTKSWLEIER